jgi:hypothetical protein
MWTLALGAVKEACTGKKFFFSHLGKHASVKATLLVAMKRGKEGRSLQ